MRTNLQIRTYKSFTGKKRVLLSNGEVDEPDTEEHDHG